MAHLRLKRLQEAEESATIDIGERLTIGRHSDNTIVIEQNSVSRHHCLIYTDDERHVFVKDLNSSNGTFVNHLRIDRVQVHEQDLLRVGSEEFLFIGEGEEHALTTYQSNVTSFLLTRRKSLLRHAYFTEKIQQVRFELRGENSVCYEYPVNTIVTVGRLKFSDIALEDMNVSRHHAVIDVRVNQVMISDSSSTNGTFVNDSRITRCELHHGDRLRIGKKYEFDVSLLMEPGERLASLQTYQQFAIIDILHDAPALLHLFQHEYDGQVLLEVERQSTLFCKEFDRITNTKVTADDKQRFLIRFLRKFLKALAGVERPLHVPTDPGNGRIAVLPQEVFDYIATLPAFQENRPVLYFEEMSPHQTDTIQMNGVIIRLAPTVDAIFYGIPYEQLLYLVSIARWLANVQM